MNNDIKAIKKWLKHAGTKMHDLSPSDLEIYHKYRTRKLLAERQVLLPLELSYLLCETGNGALRFDPDISKILTGTETQVADKRTWIYHDSDEIEKIKKRAENAVENDKVDIAKHIKKQYGLKVVSYTPMTYETVINGKKIYLYVLPNDWLMPDDNFISMLKTAYINGATPFFIAKKIHGILYPVFKNIGIGGINTYSNLVSSNTKSIIVACNEKLDQLIPKQFAHRLEYHGQYISDEEYMVRFSPLFDNFIHKRIEELSKDSRFLSHDLAEVGELSDFVSKMKRSKIKNALKQWQDSHTQLAEELKK